MKNLLHRSLTLCLVLALAVTLVLPAAAATVKVTGVTLDQTAVTLAVGESVTLYPTITPLDASNQNVTWESNQSSVASVSKGVVTARGVGTAQIAVVTSDGNYRAICNVTVEKNYVTDLTITPAGPETLPVGRTRQLSAKVTYAHSGGVNSQEVSWSSDSPNVASVSSTGLVTAVAEGQANIMAMAKEKGKDDTLVYRLYTLNVTAPGTDSSNDVLKLAQTAVSRTGGLYQTITLTAPVASVENGTRDVTENYVLAYAWTGANGQRLSSQQTISPTLTAEGTQTITCTIAAANLADSTKVLTRTCVYTIQVLPGTVLGATTTVEAGTTSLDKLMDIGGRLSVIDQLTKGDGSELTPAIKGLVDVVFYPDQATGAAGRLNVAAEQPYSLDHQATGAKLKDVTFTPLANGTYIIPFTAYGEKTWYGQLEVVVAGQGTLPVDGSDLSCDSAGLTFAGSDFFQSEDADPVAALTFGKPDHGQLLRNMAYGSGTPENGAKYYTDSAKNGDYHVSTLSYLPPAGFSGQAAIPVTYTSRSGQVVESTLTIDVRHKTASDVFVDVTPANTGNWSADGVDFAYANGFVTGVDATHFAPNETMTRAMLVTVLYRAAGSPDMTVTTNFEDLNPNSYYYTAVVWASAMGVVNGTSDTTFSPDRPVTRQQIATILYRYADLNGHTGDVVQGSLNRYVDRDQVWDYAEKGMTWAVNQGILNGTSQTTLSPNDPASRAQVAVMLHRYLA